MNQQLTKKGRGKRPAGPIRAFWVCRSVKQRINILHQRVFYIFIPYRCDWNAEKTAGLSKHTLWSMKDCWSQTQFSRQIWSPLHPFVYLLLTHSPSLFNGDQSCCEKNRRTSCCAKKRKFGKKHFTKTRAGRRLQQVWSDKRNGGTWLKIGWKHIFNKSNHYVYEK